MRFCLIVFWLITTSITSFCQKVNLITINELNDRINHGSDTVYVINFWATSCAPCIKELPYFEKLNQQFKTQKLKVLLISVDFKSQLHSSVIPFVKGKNLHSEVFFLNEENLQEVIERIDMSWSGSIPATLIIKNNKREIFEKDLTYDELVDEYKYFK